MLVHVFLNEDPEHIHQRSELMTFCLANFINDPTKQLDELLLVAPRPLTGSTTF